MRELHKFQARAEQHGKDTEGMLGRKPLLVLREGLEVREGRRWWWSGSDGTFCAPENAW